MNMGYVSKDVDIAPAFEIYPRLFEVQSVKMHSGRSTKLQFFAKKTNVNDKQEL